MLFAPRHRPTRVPGFRRMPSTSSGVSAPSTSSPVSRATPSSTPRAAAVGGTIQAPAGIARPLTVTPAVARNSGTFAFCSRAAAMKPAFDSGPITYAQRGVAGNGVCRGVNVETRVSGASNGAAIGSTVTPSRYPSVWPATSYGGCGGPPGNSRRSGYFCCSSIVLANAPYGCARRITYEPAGYVVSPALNAADA